MHLSVELILAIAAIVALGFAAPVYLARRRRSADAARAYLKGFRYILSDEPDAALEQLTRAVDLDARTLETYLALGALFRRTGDHERAIRLHKNMLLRPNLEEWLRVQIEFELALDYDRGGMFGRAVETYQAVARSRAHRREALLRLRRLYEGQRDFARAAEIERQLLEEGPPQRPSILAHLLAEAALGETDPELSSGFAQQAVQADLESAHAALARGVVALRLGKRGEAADWLKRACLLDPEAAPRACEPLLKAAGSECRLFLEGLLGRQDHPALRLALARCATFEGHAEVAARHLRRALELDTRYHEARLELGRALLESTLGDEVRKELESLFASLRHQEPTFQCRACGHGYSEPHYRCARCQGWDTVARVAAQRPARAPAKPARAP